MSAREKAFRYTLRMRCIAFAGFALALFVAGCATQSRPSWSSYPATPAERELALAHSVPTNAPFGSVYEVRIYIVQPGDTVDKILERFNLTEEQLASLNAGNRYRRIKVGERIVIFEHIQAVDDQICMSQAPIFVRGGLSGS
jgi:hypothetical protein